jgi:hypothetical protein
MPPDPSAEPACEAYMAAAALTSGSCAAYSLIVQCRALKNSGFSFRESGVGGLIVEVPIAREIVGGVFERKEYRYGRGVPCGCSWTYYDTRLAAIVLQDGGVARLLTICLLLGRVDNARLCVAGAVRAMSLWHWNDSIVLLGAIIVDMLDGVFTACACLYVGTQDVQCS